MLRLTLRTLLAYLDDSLDPASSRLIGQKVAENATAQELVDRIKKVTRKRGLSTPPSGGERSPSDPNNVSAYLSDTLAGEQVAQFEMACLESDVHLAEVAACHQILTLVLSEPMRVPPPARRRMYALVKGRESIPNRHSGDIAPVGKLLSEERQSAAADDHDDPLLLGMPAYSKGSSAARLVLTAVAVCFVLPVLALAVWLSLPTTERAPDDAGLVLAPVPVTPVKPKEPEKPKEKEPEKPKEKEPEKPKEKEPEKPKEKEPEPIAMPKEKEKPKNPVDIVPAPQPTKAEKAVVGKIEKTQPVVLRQPAGDAEWTRVTPADALVSTTDRLMALAGYKAVIKLDSGVLVDLWGNLPEFLQAPLFASSVTPTVPYEGFAADLTVTCGRIYVATTKPEGAKVRLRFADEIWDVTLPDEKTEIAFEVRRTAPRGTVPEPLQTVALLGVVAGKVTVKVRYKDYPVAKDEFLAWDSKGKGVDGPKKADGKAGPRAAYFVKGPPADNAQTKAANFALDDLAKKLSDPKRFKPVFAEALQERPEFPTTNVVAGIRQAIIALATLGDLPGLVDAINDANRPFVRQAGVVALQYSLGLNPDLANDLRPLLADKARLTPDQVTSALRLLRGLAESERQSPAAVDAVVDALSSGSVCLRELAFYTLLTDIDPEAANIRALTSFDAGGPEAKRDTTVREWKKRIDDLKKDWKKKAAPEDK